MGDWSGGLRIINVTNPASPTFLGSYPVVGDAEGIYACGSTVYLGVEGHDVTNEGLLVIDVSTPSTPTLIDSFPSDLDIEGLYLSGSRAYLAAEGDGVLIIDVSGCDDGACVTTCSTCQCPTDSPKGCISGTVSGAGAGKTVRLFSRYCNVKPPFKKLVKKLTARTDSNGCYTFTDLIDGRYDVYMTGRCGVPGGGSHQYVNIINGKKINDVNFQCQ